jgi:hypothetical protein
MSALASKMIPPMTVAGLMLLLARAGAPVAVLRPRRPDAALGARPSRPTRRPRGALWAWRKRELRARMPRLMKSWCSRRGSPRVDDTEIAQWSGALAAALRAGHSLAAAMMTCPLPPSLGVQMNPVVLALHRGVGVHDAIGAARGIAPGLDTLVGVIRMCSVTGGGAAEPLDRVASAARDRSTAQAELRSHSAQSRLSALVLTVLPGAVLALLMAISPSTRSVLSTAIGLASVSAGTALNLSGWWWMRSVLKGRA